MTSIAKKIPYFAGTLFFAVAALTSVIHGGGLVTAFSRGMVAGFVAACFTGLLSYIIFSEKLPEAKAPPGMEELEEKFKIKRP